MSERPNLVNPPELSELERELAYYRRECNELGARLLRLQEEQSQVFREARRSRTLAKLIRAANRLADTGIDPGDLGSLVLEIVVEHTLCDRAALLHEEPRYSGRFVVKHVLGFTGDVLSEISIPNPLPFFFTTAQTQIGPPAETLLRILQLPYILWAYDQATGCALIIGNRSEANVSRAFEPNDQELIEGGLAVYIEVLARKTAEMQLRETKEAAEEARRDAEAARLAAERAAQAKTDFLAVMSHEIRTPMTPVLGMAELLAAEPLTERQRGYVEAIRMSGQHLLTIINDILDLSRIEAGRLALERINFSMNNILEDVRSIMAPQASERGLRLGVTLDPLFPPVVRGDPTRLRQVLLNLVGNGLKFTREGEVTISVRSRSASGGPALVRFEVRDTGIGIPRERQAELFEAFTQADQSTTRRHGGSGLGLAICKRLVGAMGGKIGVETECGCGSLFWFEMPLEFGDAPVAPRSDILAPKNLSPLRILVAEDTATNRALLGAMLERHGHEVVFAVNGAEAVRTISEGRFDLVLMDLQMPELDGVEATHRIRRLSSPTSSVPILGITANVMGNEYHRCMEAGMNLILTKPLTWPDLLAAFTRLAAAT